jgi:hypothetical protein
MRLQGDTGDSMNPEYDLFETLPDCSVRWHGCVRGTEYALAKLKGISQQTTNECFAILAGTQKILAQTKEGTSGLRLFDNDRARECFCAKR